MSTTLMQFGTWLSVIILGPGAIAIFIWFLIDLKSMFDRAQNP